jgi:hypothetical protein
VINSPVGIDSILYHNNLPNLMKLELAAPHQKTMERESFSESEKETDTFLLTSTRQGSEGSQRLWKLLALVLSLAIISLLLIFYLSSHPDRLGQENRLGSFNTGWITELRKSLQ